MLDTVLRKLGRGVLGRQVTLIVLLALGSVVVAQFLDSPAGDQIRFVVWEPPAGALRAVPGDASAKAGPCLPAVTSQPRAVPLADHGQDNPRPAGEGTNAPCPSGGIGSVGFLGLLVIVVVAVVLFHLLQAQGRDRDRE